MSESDNVPRDRTADRRAGIQAFDRGWQFPAITERHAYCRIRETGGLPPGMIYVAYPWATLIDKLQVSAADARMHLDSFRAFCLGLPETRMRITVCQHILMPRFRHLFDEAGITHLFWSHATRPLAEVAEVCGDVATGAMTPAGVGRGAVSETGTQGPAGLNIHPFPLYPVQMPHMPPDQPARGPKDRPWLYSFVGMRPNAWYLTQVRAFVLDLLADDPRGYIQGRKDWHYKQIVYQHQVLDQAPKGRGGRPKQPLVDTRAEDQFRQVLCDSVFALCPSGSGPNSIRLWEAIMADTIPVILAETYAPPGDPDLWAAATVRCAETPEAVQALPDRLAAIAAEPARLATMRAALAQLRARYGPQGFVSDIEDLARAQAGAGATAAMPMSERAAARYLLARTSERILGRRPQPPCPDLIRALSLLPPEHPVRQHHDQIMGRAT